MRVNIHGKEYITVAERLNEAREDIQSIITEVVPDGGLVVVRATVTTKKGVFTGISAANPSKAIEKQSPYEVAETSAVGRALGFAGYGAVDSIATADEMVKSGATQEEEEKPSEFRVCSVHTDENLEPSVMKQGKSKSTGKEYWYHLVNSKYCFGSGIKE